MDTLYIRKREVLCKLATELQMSHRQKLPKSLWFLLTHYCTMRCSRTLHNVQSQINIIYYLQILHIAKLRVVNLISKSESTTISRSFFLIKLFNHKNKTIINT